ncbi:hypothetical protein [Aurantimonas marina]|uniref:hypothetical protein n=1 Tax=Aurantimonas marina TaxID=2780508 RepID=UPI0019D1E207|nr:hypothetical protein [Aurantimonas marina]
MLDLSPSVDETSRMEIVVRAGRSSSRAGIARNVAAQDVAALDSAVRHPLRLRFYKPAVIETRSTGTITDAWQGAGPRRTACPMRRIEPRVAPDRTSPFSTIE